MAVLLHAVSLAGVCRKERISPVPQVRARPEEMRCVGSKRTRELGRDMLLAASIVESSVAKAPTWEKSHCALNMRGHLCHAKGSKKKRCVFIKGEVARAEW